MFKISTPICDFVENYERRNSIRLHMPGHKGKKYLGFEESDITEIQGADYLYDANGIIFESEKNASLIFGSGSTVYSTEGSSQCILAMLYLACLYNNRDEKPTIIATRNVHKAFIRGCVLLDFNVKWLVPEDLDYSLCKCTISAEQVEQAFNSSKNVVALFVTSPDYLGNVLDIEQLSKIAHKHKGLMLVDNAHGAYLKFLPKSMHPIDLGADFCCDSAHKTLPCLTGSAYLHASKKAPASLISRLKNAMEMFGSTSPSYLILQSLDLVNQYLYSDYKLKLNLTIENINKLANFICEKGWEVSRGGDLLKLTIKPLSMGYTGTSLSKLLMERYNIVCEYADYDNLVMMFTPEILEQDFNVIYQAFSVIEKLRPIPKVRLKFKLPKQYMSCREASFKLGVPIKIEDSLNRVVSSLCVSCPPAVSCVVLGEVIEKEHIEILKHYGIENITVLSN